MVNFKLGEYLSCGRMIIVNGLKIKIFKKGELKICLKKFKYQDITES